MRLLICLSILLSVSLNYKVFAEGSNLDKATLEKLSVLEKRYFGHSFDSDSDENRAGRLEQLVYGEESSAELKDRINRLVKTAPEEEAATTGSDSNKADKISGNKKQKQDKTANTSTEADANEIAGEKDKTETPAEYPHVNALEKAILGEVHANEALSSRLNRLEQSAFGAVSQSPDFVQRTDALDNYAQKKLHKNLALTPDYDSPKAQSAPATGVNKQKVLASVANTVFGIAGLGAMAMGPKMGPLSNFGGIRFQQRQADPNAPEQQIFEEDPSIRSSQPPPPEAKTLIKVSWCEDKVFGRTYANMHLTDRLRQLSQQLQYDTSKSGLELMDDISGFIRAVQAQAKTKPISTSSSDPAPGPAF